MQSVSVKICPQCIVELVPTDRKGIEVDFCPKCRGIWLDRGELEKLIERSIGSPYDDRNARGNSGYRDDDRDQSYGRDHHEDRSRNEHGDRGYREGQHGDKRRRGSFLGDLFDFD